MLEVVKKGNIPLPDLSFTESATIATDVLDLDYTKGNTFQAQPDGSYKVLSTCEEKGLKMDVHLKPVKPVCRQGNSGVVDVGIRSETMFYYFIPRNELTGSLTIGDKTFSINGTGWYDHEFGGGIRAGVYEGDSTQTKEKQQEKAEKDSSLAWNWFSMQLDQDIDITATNLVDITSNTIRDNFLILIDKEGTRTECHDMVVKSSDPWISVRSGNLYPLNWTLTVPSIDLELKLEAVFANQEVFTLLSRPAYWEGRLAVTGTYKGEPITGTCFLERHGFDEIDSLDRFFKVISTLVRKEIHEVVPFNPTRQQCIDLMANNDNTHYLDGVSPAVLEKTMIAPLRDIIDRGGKSWRSYALLLCIDAVGGDSFKYQHWLAMPEMMHVGSLIIDDIQDKSALRRGKPCAHHIYGEDIAINAGCGAYFLAMHLLQSRTPDLTPEMRNTLYDLYFLTLRAGHCGQGFDLYGLEYRLESALDTGDVADLLLAVTATHRLKSAVPAGNLARMGAHIGGGTKIQIDAIGAYLEAVGIAFQIMDDVLNLSGLEDDGRVLKSCGEDLHEGKITYPVARGFGSMTPEERREFWAKLKTKPDYDVVYELIKKLMDPKVNALKASINDATQLVENAFQELDKVIPDSYYKIMLRAFGDYVLDRHY
jgi:geranylgeranyl pyrophosphate synthase